MKKKTFTYFKVFIDKYTTDLIFESVLFILFLFFFQKNTHRTRDRKEGMDGFFGRNKTSKRENE